MTALNHPTNREGSLLIGGGLIVVGLVSLAMLTTDIDPSRWLGGSGWTLFVIGPGVLLLATGLVTRRPSSRGLTIGGAVVTTVGLIMLTLDQADAWESWAYAWALIPAAVGGALVLYGLRAGDRPAVGTGIRMAVISLVMALVGGWYFETVFRTGEPPFGLGDAWPIVLIAIGAVVLSSGLIGRGRDADEPTL